MKRCKVHAAPRPRYGTIGKDGGMNLLSRLILLSLMLTSCSGTSALVTKAQTPDNSGVSAVVKQELPPEQGYADLTVAATLKTHPERADDLHGTADYMLVVNLDGEPLHLRGVRHRESEESLPEKHPEAGDGVRYRFQSHLRLKAGTHRIIVSLPVEDIAVEREIQLDAMTDSVLEIKPSYFSDPQRRSPGSAGASSFKEGIFGIELYLNGERI